MSKEKETLDASTEMFAEDTTEKLNESTMSLSNLTLNSINNIKKFDPRGNISIHNWLRYFEKKTATLSEEDRLQCVSDFLEGSALDYYIEELMDLTSWKEISHKLLDFFEGEKVFTFTDFTELKFLHCRDVREYFSKKLSIGKHLKLDSSLIIQGLTDGLPERKKEFFLIRDVTTTEEWLRIAQRLIKPFPVERQQIRRDCASGVGGGSPRDRFDFQRGGGPRHQVNLGRRDGGN